MSRSESSPLQRLEIAMTDEELADFYLAPSRLNCLRRYFRNGRRFLTLSDDLLEAQWVEAHRTALAAALEGPIELYLFVRLHCELEVRDIEPPWHLVTKDRARFKDHVERLCRDNKPDPIAWARIHAELAALRARVAKMDR